jgi:hypothetical protein
MKVPARELTAGQTVRMPISGFLETITTIESTDGYTSCTTEQGSHYMWPDTTEFTVIPDVDAYQRLQAVREIAAWLEDTLEGDSRTAAKAIHDISSYRVSPNEGLANAWPGQH